MGRIPSSTLQNVQDLCATSIFNSLRFDLDLQRVTSQTGMLKLEDQWSHSPHTSRVTTVSARGDCDVMDYQFFIAAGMVVRPEVPRSYCTVAGSYVRADLEPINCRSLPLYSLPLSVEKFEKSRALPPR